MATLVFWVAIALIVVVNTPLVSPCKWLEGAYPVTAALLIVAILAIGYALNGRPEGLIIDNRNRMSLSKLQMLIWTVVVVSALVVYAAYNVRLCPCNTTPLEITIPQELLFAMGIAATSFVATPTILSLKSQDKPTTDDVKSANAAAVANNATLQNSGKVHGRGDPSDAKWSDIFRGDEVGNFDSPDLSKIQQFAITILLVGIYSAQIIACLAGKSCDLTAKDCTGATLNSLPVLGHDFIVLLAISHASYLVYKAAPHTATGSDSTPNAQSGNGGQADNSQGDNGQADNTQAAGDQAGAAGPGGNG